MCVVSMVYDRFQPFFPPQPIGPFTPPPGYPWGDPIGPFLPQDDPAPWGRPDVSKEQQKAIDAWKKLIEDFTKAKEAAEIVDKLTGQPDCVDPEKAKLEERVKQLEAEIEALKAPTDRPPALPAKEGRYSIKSSIYKTSRPSSFDGPWMPSYLEAAEAFKVKFDLLVAADPKMKNKSIHHAFVAQESTKERASSSDGKKYYRVRKDLAPELEDFCYDNEINLG